MRVAELIRCLQQLDQNQQVVIEYGGHEEYASVEVLSAKMARRYLDDKYEIPSYSGSVRNQSRMGETQPVICLTF